jgi:hypothetical protein
MQWPSHPSQPCAPSSPPDALLAARPPTHAPAHAARSRTSCPPPARRRSPRSRSRRRATSGLTPACTRPARATRSGCARTSSPAAGASRAAWCAGGRGARAGREQTRGARSSVPLPAAALCPHRGPTSRRLPPPPRPAARAPQRDQHLKISWECAEQLFKQELEADEDLRLSVRLFQRCLGDKKRFCPDVDPGHAEAKDCLIEHRNDNGFSGPCRCGARGRARCCLAAQRGLSSRGLAEAAPDGAPHVLPPVCCARLTQRPAAPPPPSRRRRPGSSSRA